MDPKTVVQNFWDDYESGDIESTWNKWISPDIVVHPASGFEFTRESWKATEQALIDALEDVKVEVLDQVLEGDMVATRWTITGTQRREFLGVPPSGKRATVTGITFDRVQNDQVVEHWAEVGVALFLQQLAC